MSREDPLFTQFQVEGRDLLAQASDELLALEAAPRDRERMDMLFRTIHTLKGSTGLFALQPLTRILHAAEDLLDAVRGGQAAADDKVIELLLETLDRAGEWIDLAQPEAPLPAGCEAPAADLAARLRARIDGTDAPTAGPEAHQAWLAGLTAGERAQVAQALSQGAPTPWTAVTYVPDERCFFRGEDPLRIITALPGLTVLRMEAKDDWPAPAAMDPFTCTIRLHGLAACTLDEAQTALRAVTDQVRLNEIDPDTLVKDSGTPGAGTTDPQDGPRRGATDALRDGALAVLAEQLLALGEADRGPGHDGRLAAVAATAANVLHTVGEDTLGAEIAGLARDEEGLRAGILRARVALSVGADEGTAQGAGRPGGQHDRVVRVDQGRIDHLIDLSGELIVAKNALAFLIEQAEAVTTPAEGAALARALKDHRASMERLGREVHRAAIGMRMVPADRLLRRFPRLVRDTARNLGKEVSLEISGGEVEADKDLVEGLFEPLLHVVRNALDHGIEPPDDRLAAGKPRAGTIGLRARHDGDLLVIEVSDDGRGIDAEAVRSSAIAAGVLDAAQAAELGEAALRDLIFAAGVSTRRAEASDVSGRGVGMDAALAFMNRNQGRITVESTPAQGTTVRLSMPAGVRVSRLMTVEAGGRRFGIPLDAVAETVRVPHNDIRTVKDRRAVVLREEVLALVGLETLLELNDEPARGDGGATGAVRALVTGTAGARVAVAVDAFGPRLEALVRPMDGLLEGLPGYAGTTLLGDGQVLLVLDLDALLAGREEAR